jgi:hypothetical protein
VLLLGSGFGPAAPAATGGAQLLQRVTYGPTGAQYALPAGAATVVNDSVIAATLPAGAGVALQVIVTGADQSSAPSPAVTFSYALPVILSLSPAALTTGGSAADGAAITLSCAACGVGPGGALYASVTLYFNDGRPASLASRLTPAQLADVYANMRAGTTSVYAAQMAIYQAYMEATVPGISRNPALFTAINKDSQAIWFELVPFDGGLAQRMSDRAVRVISASESGELLPRHTTTPTHFECKFCSWQDRCWRAT